MEYVMEGIITIGFATLMRAIVLILTEGTRVA